MAPRCGGAAGAKLRRPPDAAEPGAAAAERSRRAAAIAAAADNGERRLLAQTARLLLHRFDGVEIAAVAGDDAVQLGQSLDLIDDDAAHLRGAFGGFLRQFEHAAAQFGAGRLELALHFGGHLLHVLHGLGEAFAGIAEQSSGVAGGLLRRSGACPARHRRSVHWRRGTGGRPRDEVSAWTVRMVSSRAGPFQLGVLTHALELFADGAGAVGARSDTRRATSRARLDAASSDSSSRPEKRLRRCSISSVRMSRVATSRVELHAAFADGVFGALVGAVDQFGGLGRGRGHALRTGRQAGRGR